MNNYKFSLQSVLDWRRDQEDEANRNLVQAKAEQKQEEIKLQQLINENIYLKEKSLSSKGIIELRQQSLYKELLNDRIIQQKLIVEQVENDTRIAEKALLESYKEKEVMKKLKENEFEDYLENLKNEEQKQLDEFATISFKREVFQ